MPVCNSVGEVTHQLQKAIRPEFENEFYKEQQQLIERFGSLDNYWNQTPISCRVANEKSVYIAATGHVLPCCWVASDINPLQSLNSNHPLAKLAASDAPDLPSLCALNSSVEHIVQGPLFQSQIPESWGQPSLEEGRIKACARTCGQGLKPFERQFV